MKKLIICIAPMFLGSCLFVGCVAVPSTTVNGTVNGHPFAVTSPKDVQGLDVVVETNGTFHFHLDSSKNNPDVITATGVAQAQTGQIYIAGFTDALNIARGVLGDYLRAGGTVNITTNK